MPLQIKTVRVLFSKLGAPVVPGSLLRLLQDFDPSFAVQEFFKTLRIEKEAVLNPEHPSHSADRIALVRYVELYAAAEAAATDTSLDFQPLLEAWKRGEPTEESLSQLERAGSAWRTVGGLPGKWRFVQRFQDEVRSRLRDWWSLVEVDYQQIFSGSSKLEAAAARFKSHSTELHRLAHVIRSAPSLGHHAALVGAAQARLEFLEVELRSTDSDPLGWIEELARLVSELAAAAEDHRVPNDPMPKTDRLAWCFRVLGLATAATMEEVKAAWRRLAMLYHPDRNPGDAVAAELMKQVNQARDWIIKAHFGGSP